MVENLGKVSAHRQYERSSCHITKEEWSERKFLLFDSGSQTFDCIV